MKFILEKIDSVQKIINFMRKIINFTQIEIINPLNLDNAPMYLLEAKIKL